jgi:hypothetical protein
MCGKRHHLVLPHSTDYLLNLEYTRILVSIAVSAAISAAIRPALITRNCLNDSANAHRPHLRLGNRFDVVMEWYQDKEIAFRVCWKINVKSGPKF